MAEMNTDDLPYTKVGEDEESYTLRHNDDGEHFQIAKDGLSDDMHDVLGKLPSDDSAKESENIDDDKPDYKAVAVDQSKNSGFNDDIQSTKQVHSEAAPSAIDLNAQTPESHLQNLTTAQVDHAAGQVEPQSFTINPNEGLPPATDPNAIHFASDRAPAQTTQTPESASKEPQAAGIDPSQVKTVAPKAPTQSNPNDLTSGLLKQQAGLERQEMSGINQRSQAAQDLASQKQNIINQQIEQERKDQELAQKNFSDMHQFAQEGLKKLQSMSDEATKSAVINPNRYWSEKSTGSKISASIGIALGAIGSALTGQKNNPALDIVERAIERDIDAQKSQANSKSMALNNATNIYSATLKMYGDQNLALQAQRTAHWQAAELMVKAQEAKAQGSDQAGAFKMMGAQVGEKYLQNHLQLQTLMMQRAAFQQAQSGGLSPQMLPYLSKDMQEKAVRLPSGTLGFAYSPKQQEEVIKASTAHDKIMDTIQRMRDLQAEAGRSNNWSTASAQAKALQAKLLPLLNEYAGINRFTSEDYEKVLKDQVADPTAMRQGMFTAMIDQLEEGVRRDHELLLKNNVIGYKPSTVERKY